MQRNQLRLQQQAAAQGMGYPGPACTTAARSVPGQPGGMVPRPRYAPAGMMPQGMPMAPYGQPGQFSAGMMPQGYRPARPPRGAPNAAGGPAPPAGARPPAGVNGAPRPAGQPVPGSPCPAGPGARPAGPLRATRLLVLSPPLRSPRPARRAEADAWRSHLPRWRLASPSSPVS